jgi:uncharacterized protein (UPF0128 family)
MNISILNYVENEDGSADVEVRLDEESTKFLINEGFKAVLLAAIKRETEDRK